MPIYNDNCVTVPVPPTSSNYCNATLKNGRIDAIYIGNVGNSFTDVSSLTEWNDRLDNSDTVDLTKIRTLHVIGSKPRPEREDIEYSLGRVYSTPPEHTIDIKVDDTSNTNYELVQWLDENQGTIVSIWYEVGGDLYGGNDGIPANLSLNHVIPEDNKQLQTFEGSISWKGTHPDRITSPLS